MEKYAKQIRYILFLGILFILIIPFIQSKFTLRNIAPLNGDIKAPVKGNFSKEEWFSGEYQKKEEIYLAETFGFRNWAIRINNEIGFKLFKKAKANSVIVGKDNYLFEENYIDAYYGSDYIGDDSLAHRMERLEYINDTLKKLGKDFIIVFAAGKGSYYPEYFPDKYKREKTTTNHDSHVEYLKKLDIDYIDFHSYFIDNKKKSACPLYPKYGIHWSYYGMCLAADSMIRFIEKEREIDMPNLYWDEVSIEQPKNYDYDIAAGMNLLFKLKSEEMVYPVVRLESNSGKSKPSVLVVGDSFYWGISDLGFPDAFSNPHFWFYNKQVYPESKTIITETNQLNLADEIAKHDIIMIMSTEAKLPNLGWGFIEDTYKMFKGKE